MEIKTFIPGSEWLYTKLYTGTKTADAILKNNLYEYVNEMLQNGVIDKWFFIRYTDPDFHIRLRLHLKDTRNFTFVFNRFFEYFQPIVNNGLVWDIQFNTYQREIVRYGTNTISLVEDIFFIDSEFIIKLFNLLNEENPEQHRWKLSLSLIDNILSAFLFELPQRNELLNTTAESFKKEFGFTHHHVTKQLNDKHRSNRKEIENAMNHINEVSEIIEIIEARRRAIFPIAEKIIGIEQSGDLQIPMKSLLTSLIHMTMNRWFRTKNRLYEMVVYEFLSRYYASEIAKKVFRK